MVGILFLKMRPQFFTGKTHIHTHMLYLFGVLCCFQYCTGHITTGSWKGRGNQYIQFVRVLYFKLPTNGKQLPAFPLEAMPGTEPQPHRWETRELPVTPYTHTHACYGAVPLEADPTTLHIYKVRDKNPQKKAGNFWVSFNSVTGRDTYRLVWI